MPIRFGSPGFRCPGLPLLSNHVKPRSLEPRLRLKANCRNMASITFLTIVVSRGSLPVMAADWPQFRGSASAGISDEKGLPTTWPVFYSLNSKALSFQRVTAGPFPCGTMRHVFVKSSSVLLRLTDSLNRRGNCHAGGSEDGAAGPLGFGAE